MSNQARRRSSYIEGSTAGTTSVGRLTFGRRRRYKRRGLYRRRGPRTVLGKAWRYGGYARAPELKYRDDAVVNQQVDDFGIINTVSTVPQGPGPNERVGRKIKIVSVQAKWTCYTSVASTIAGWRIIWFWDHQPNKTVATANDLLENVPGHQIANFRDENRLRFTILKDTLFTTSGALGEAEDPPIEPEMVENSIVTWKEYIKINLGETVYGGATGVAGEIIQGSLLYMVVTTTPQASNNNEKPTWANCVRIRFTDF